MTISTPSEPILLIGPMKCGKSTVGKLLAERLGWPFYSLDRLERQYTPAAGYDHEAAIALEAKEGGLARYYYRRNFFDEAVVGFLAEHTAGVLELGGGHPIAPSEAQQQRINAALAPFRFVVLLMPLPDLQSSLQILNARQSPEYRQPDLNELFLADNRFFDLAKFVLYTDGKSPDELCEEIIARVGSLQDQAN